MKLVKQKDDESGFVTEIPAGLRAGWDQQNDRPRDHQLRGALDSGGRVAQEGAGAAGRLGERDRAPHPDASVHRARPPWPAGRARRRAGRRGRQDRGRPGVRSRDVWLETMPEEDDRKKADGQDQQGVFPGQGLPAQERHHRPRQPATSGGPAGQCAVSRRTFPKKATDYEDRRLPRDDDGQIESSSIRPSPQVTRRCRFEPAKVLPPDQARRPHPLHRLRALDDRPSQRAIAAALGLRTKQVAGLSIARITRTALS